jgi:hypothetical protein
MFVGKPMSVPEWSTSKMLHSGRLWPYLQTAVKGFIVKTPERVFKVFVLNVVETGVLINCLQAWTAWV